MHHVAGMTGWLQVGGGVLGVIKETSAMPPVFALFACYSSDAEQP